MARHYYQQASSNNKIESFLLTFLHEKEKEESKTTNVKLFMNYQLISYRTIFRYILK